MAGIDGNGQTELVYALTGLHEPDSGHVLLKGEDITHAHIRTRNMGGLGHIPEDRHRHGLVLDYSLAYNLVLHAPDRTLTDEEAEATVAKVLGALAAMGVALRS